MDALYDNVLSSSSEEEGYERVRPRRRRVIKDRVNYFQTLDDVDFFTRFRLRKNTVAALLNDIEQSLRHTTARNNAIEPMNQLLLTLRYYATGSHLIAAADFAGVSKTSACRIVHRVTIAIAALGRQEIKLPCSQEEISAAQIDFYAIARFPKVIAALDCTHIRVQSFGGDNAEVFRNRKGYFSINVQATCDSHLKFTSIVARWPGSVHDSTIFRNSRLCARLEAAEFGGALVLADGGYALKKYLITPLSEPATAAERLFNEAQIRTRNKIECTFGVWKRRFPCLVTGMRFTMDHVLPVIVATAVLHNKARLAGEDMPANDPTLNIRWDLLLNENIENQANLPAEDRRARQNIIAYFQDLLNRQ